MGSGPRRSRSPGHGAHEELIPPAGNHRVVTLGGASCKAAEGRTVPADIDAVPSPEPEGVKTRWNVGAGSHQRSEGSWSCRVDFLGNE